MKLICSNCGHVISADDAEMDAVARETLHMALGLPGPCQDHLLRYLRLFAPRGRVLVWTKARRLVGELAGLVASGYVQRGNAPARQAGPALWGEAMRKTVENPPPRTPLKKGHGYLASVAWDLADRADREQETARNAAERSGAARPQRDDTGPEAMNFDDILPPDEVSAMLDKKFPNRRRKSEVVDGE